MYILVCLFLFCVGTILASFLGVIITRLRESSWKHVYSVIVDRSSCDQCKSVLKRRQLIPLVGYAYQRGRCCMCKKKISQRMSWFELTLGICFAMGVYVLPINVTLIYIYAIVALLLGLLIADLLYMEINLILLGCLYIVVIIYHATIGILSYTRLRSTTLGIGFLLIYGLGRLIAKRKFGVRQEGFGFGDVLVSIPIGLLLGQILGNLAFIDRIWWLYVYILISAVCMLVYILGHKIIRQSQQQYFPFLVGMIGGLLVMSCWLLPWSSIYNK